MRIPARGHGGWKAGFLILARNHARVPYTEVAYRLETRVAGESKLGPMTALRILWELQRARSMQAGP